MPRHTATTVNTPRVCVWHARDCLFAGGHRDRMRETFDAGILAFHRWQGATESDAELYAEYLRREREVYGTACRQATEADRRDGRGIFQSEAQRAAVEFQLAELSAAIAEFKTQAELRADFETPGGIQ